MLSRTYAALLGQGDYDQGWIKYQWRWRTGRIQRPAVMERLSAWDPAGPPSKPLARAARLPLAPRAHAAAPAQPPGRAFVQAIGLPLTLLWGAPVAVTPERAGA